MQYGGWAAIPGPPSKPGSTQLALWSGRHSPNTPPDPFVYLLDPATLRFSTPESILNATLTALGQRSIDARFGGLGGSGVAAVTVAVAVGIAAVCVGGWVWWTWDENSKYLFPFVARLYRQPQDLFSPSPTPMSDTLWDLPDPPSSPTAPPPAAPAPLSLVRRGAAPSPAPSEGSSVLRSLDRATHTRGSPTSPTTRGSPWSPSPAPSVPSMHHVSHTSASAPTSPPHPPPRVRPVAKHPAGPRPPPEESKWNWNPWHTSGPKLRVANLSRSSRAGSDSVSASTRSASVASHVRVPVGRDGGAAAGGSGAAGAGHGRQWSVGAWSRNSFDIFGPQWVGFGWERRAEESGDEGGSKGWWSRSRAVSVELGRERERRADSATRSGSGSGSGTSGDVSGTEDESDRTSCITESSIDTGGKGVAGTGGHGAKLSWGSESSGPWLGGPSPNGSAGETAGRMRGRVASGLSEVSVISEISALSRDGDGIVASSGGPLAVKNV
ncbi:hypothetical protein M427DRAFT_201368 [Gonapodya prolifera JEL478]|uniref:Uncharacterized protein n=1 Tax=Gonapodya prolifera (strain JEL478) TaxID=1344416 RepID=A0A139A098_GONPJ|nr:hypothetical protein M427DRAFT_201368 [Gonapodya prolifera JEL478]|eukprot:KXS09965.1 hypothetical protein M427DRAFT_201368 [Gonapodya prolifera JEL478]